MVLYKSDFQSSPTLQSIQKIDEQFKEKISLDIYDNSPKPSKDDYARRLMNFKSVNYVSDVRNPGLSAAYNYALNRCGTFGDKWLLLLDQDTVVTNHFFEQVIKLADGQKSDHTIAAIIPDIAAENGSLLVPVRVSKVLGRYSFFNHEETVVSDEVRTINSCSLIRVDFLNEIGGFNIAFKLDCLDHWLFHTIYQRKKSVYLTHERIEHHLSVKNTDTYVSTERYKSILDSEQLFYSHYASRMNYMYFKVRLMRRAVKQLLKVKNKEILRMTLKSIMGIKL